MTLKEAKERRRRRVLVYKALQRGCAALATFGLLLVLFAGAIADNPVSPLAMMVVYLVLGLVMMAAGYFGACYFLQKERELRRHGKCARERQLREGA